MMRGEENLGTGVKKKRMDQIPRRMEREWVSVRNADPTLCGGWLQ